MALVVFGQSKCALCGKTLERDDEILGFPCVGILEPRFVRLDDSCIHQSCLDEWSDRDNFVEYWNRNHSGIVGDRNWFQLVIDDEGRTSYAK